MSQWSCLRGVCHWKNKTPWSNFLAKKGSIKPKSLLCSWNFIINWVIQWRVKQYSQVPLGFCTCSMFYKVMDLWRWLSQFVSALDILALKLICSQVKHGYSGSVLEGSIWYNHSICVGSSEIRSALTNVTRLNSGVWCVTVHLADVYRRYPWCRCDAQVTLTGICHVLRGRVYLREILVSESELCLLVGTLCACNRRKMKNQNTTKGGTEQNVVFPLLQRHLPAPEAHVRVSVCYRYI